MEEQKKTCIDCLFWFRCKNDKKVAADDKICNRFKVDDDLINIEIIELSKLL